MYDELTGLFNRAQFFKVLSEGVQDAVLNRSSLALLVIDIQRFHKINQNMGYAAGDAVLQGVGGVLRQVGREGDFLARIGDDRFAMLLARIANAGHARLAAMKVQRLLEIPFQVAEREVRCNAFIGISLCPANASKPGLLMQSAELALDHARLADEPIGYIEPKDDNAISANWDLELMLEDSIRNGELKVFFQPKISLKTGLPVGAEALVRWESAARGMLSPGAFMPIADATGFTKKMTLWILNSALRLSAKWTQKWGKLSVSVNIPPSMFAFGNFVDLVMSAEKLWERDNVDLCLEVLEQSMVGDDQSAYEKLNALRERGVTIAIDDFGTGYSSLAYFRDLPADELKIDQSFIMGLKKDKANIHIVSLVLELARRFNLKVIAEGVEEADVASFLSKKGCDVAQGFYYAKPMSAERFEEWLLDFTPESFVSPEPP